jgi:hypothetical protein
MSAIFTGLGLFYIYTEIEENKRQSRENNMPRIFTIENLIKIPNEFNFNSSSFFVEIVNAGRFHAYDVKYRWNFETKEVIDYLSKNEYEKVESLYAPITFVKPIQYTEEGFIKGEDGFIKFIIADQNYKAKIHFPLFLVAFLVEYAEENKSILRNDDADTQSDRIFKSISLDLEYCDLSHNKYKLKCSLHKTETFITNSFSVKQVS